MQGGLVKVGIFTADQFRENSILIGLPSKRKGCSDSKIKRIRFRKKSEKKKKELDRIFP